VVNRFDDRKGLTVQPVYSLSSSNKASNSLYMNDLAPVVVSVKVTEIVAAKRPGRAYLEREWGPGGYLIERINSLPRQSDEIRVRNSDSVPVRVSEAKLE
jgi:hypothetical protein